MAHAMKMPHIEELCSGRVAFGAESCWGGAGQAERPVIAVAGRAAKAVVSGVAQSEARLRMCTFRVRKMGL